MYRSEGEEVGSPSNPLALCIDTSAQLMNQEKNTGKQK